MAVINKERTRLLNEKQQIVKMLLEDQYTKNIICNFIDIYDKGHYSILLDPSYLSAFEAFLIKSFKIRYANELILFNSYLPEDFNNLPQTYIDNFIKLINLFKKKSYLPMDNNIGAYCLWEAMNILANKVYTDEFLKYAGDHIRMESYTYNDCLIKFLEIDELDTDDTFRVSEFCHALLFYNVRKKKKDFIGLFVDVVNDIGRIKEENDLTSFESLLLNNSIIQQTKSNTTIYDTDLMTGIEFESLVANLFKKMGYMILMTPSTGDQGIDIIAEKDSYRYGIQVKRYSSNVSNKAIQEVTAGLNYYKLNKGIVVTNSFFTKSAVTLAHTNNIWLWDRNVLIEKLKLLY